ncbi:MAG: ATP-binding protein [Candidatus Asgardarchaeia archaeon]
MNQSRIFVNRVDELKTLNTVYKKQGFSLVLITGRRRIGKSRLIEEFLKDKEGLRVQFEKRKPMQNLMKFNKVISRYFDIPEVKYTNFSDSFEFFRKQVKQKRIILALDEFSYLIRYSDAFAEFQSIVDEILNDSNIMLIISGSALSLLKRSFFSYTSPLYGRSDATIFLQPLKFKHLFEWFPMADVESLIKLYSVVGGIPRYLEFFEARNIDNEIQHNFFDPSSFLFREAKELFEEEFDEPEMYFSIVEAISHGNTRVTDIANYCFAEAKNISKYLKILSDLEIIRREFPIFSKKKKGGIYQIIDNYFLFWFRFVSKYFEDIESGYPDEAINDFSKYFNTFLGVTFERIVKEILIDFGRHNLLPFKPKKIGRWWYKDSEIDLVIANENRLLLFEVKWTDLSKSDVSRIIDLLKEKSQIFKDKQIVYGVFARHIDKKQDLKDEYLIFDLNDILAFYGKNKAIFK